MEAVLIETVLMKAVLVMPILVQAIQMETASAGVALLQATQRMTPILRRAAALPQSTASPTSHCTRPR